MIPDHQGETMQARTVNAGHGWLWVREGFGLFRQSPILWIVLFAIYLFIGMALSMVPLVGSVVFNLLAPVFMAGFMMGCRDLQRGEDLEINHLFVGFKHNTAQLVSVGGIYLAGVIVVVGIVFMVSGGEALKAVATQQGADAMQNLPDNVRQELMLGLLMGMACLLPLVMAYWFAPILVYFHDMKAVDAMKLSLNACLANIMPFLVFGLASMALLFVAMIPFGLGLVVVIPTMTAALFVSYRDIFAVQPAEASSLVEY